MLTIVAARGCRGRQQPARGSSLMNPDALTEQAPAGLRSRSDLAGSFVVSVQRDCAERRRPFGNLVKSGFYDGKRFYRVTPLMPSGAPTAIRSRRSGWARIHDDPTRKRSNLKGTVAFFVQNRRTTQTFINLADNPGLDYQIPPFGEVVSGMDVVEKLYAGYGEARPTGKGPELTPFYEQGNAYLEREFPRLDFIKKATLQCLFKIYS